MPIQDKVGEILSLFPGPVTLYPSLNKWVMAMLSSAALAAVGMLMILTNNAFGWFLVACFGPGTLAAVVAMSSGASALELDRQGFEVTRMYRRTSFDWHSTYSFDVAKLPRSEEKLVVFDDANERDTLTARMNVGALGHNAALPDTYGMSAEELAHLMAQWRERAVT